MSEQQIQQQEIESNPLFLGDGGMFTLWAQERVNVSVPEIKYIELKRDPNKFDPIYGEPATGKEWEDAIGVPIFIDPQPSSKVLTSFGFQTTTDGLVGVMTQMDAEEAGLKPLDGDVIFYRRAEWNLRNVVKDNFWGPRTDGFDYVFQLSQRRYSSVRDNRALKESDQEFQGLDPYPSFDEVPVTDEEGDIVGMF